MCCKVMNVPGVKKDHQWCRHAEPGRSGGACKIYGQRPTPCREFYCQWLLDNALDEHWYPKKAKIVISTATAGWLLFVVDPDYPERWREQPWLRDIKDMAMVGIGRKPGWRTAVLVGDERIEIGL